MVPPKSELPSASEKLSSAVRFMSLLERHSCQGASGPVPSTMMIQVLLSAQAQPCPRSFRSCIQVYPAKFPLVTCPCHLSPLSYFLYHDHPGNRTWLLRWRLWRREFLPQPIYLSSHTLSKFLRGGRPLQGVKIYIDLRIHVPLGPVLSHYLAPVKTIGFLPGYKLL